MLPVSRGPSDRRGDDRGRRDDRSGVVLEVELIVLERLGQHPPQQLLALARRGAVEVDREVRRVVVLEDADPQDRIEAVLSPHVKGDCPTPVDA